LGSTSRKKQRGGANAKLKQATKGKATKSTFFNKDGSQGRWTPRKSKFTKKCSHWGGKQKKDANGTRIFIINSGFETHERFEVIVSRETENGKQKEGKMGKKNEAGVVKINFIQFKGQKPKKGGFTFE